MKRTDAAPRPFALYRIFAADNTLIYIGRSIDLMDRLRHHSTRNWAREIDHIMVEWLSTRTEASLAEREAIRRENPKYNVYRTRATCPKCGDEVVITGVRSKRFRCLRCASTARSELYAKRRREGYIYPGHNPRTPPVLAEGKACTKCHGPVHYAGHKTPVLVCLPCRTNYSRAWLDKKREKAGLPPLGPLPPYGMRRSKYMNPEGAKVAPLLGSGP